LSKIKELFNDTDEKNIVWLSTCHRSKGLEADNVFVLRWTFIVWLDENMKLIEKPNEECNIAYVSATRTKKNLFIVRKTEKNNDRIKMEHPVTEPNIND